MADLDVRHHGGGFRGGQGRKRRHREDDDNDHRPQRRRYEEPFAIKLRRQLIAIGEVSIRDPKDDIEDLAKAIVENKDDQRVQETLFDLIIQLVLEQPLKIPFVAAVVLYANDSSPEVATLAIANAFLKAKSLLDAGDFRGFKLVLRFFACLQGLFEGDGVYSVLDELFNQAVDCQAASSEDVIGLELVKIILFTIPYIVATSDTASRDKALELLGKTDLIASTSHALDGFVETYPVDSEDKPYGFDSVMGLLQKQLQAEAESGWAVACIPRLYRRTADDGSETSAPKNKHAMPAITMPSPINPGPVALFPEAYFSLYRNQDVETVPKVTDLASSLVRDCLVDTINILDFNRVASAKILIDMDSYWTPGTFVKRGTPFDKLKGLEGEKTWKPEDLAMDAMFSQIFKLPNADHKLVYYHSVITEACRTAPAAIAPSLGRAIRFLFRHVHVMDMELSFRFLDWFAHHLSNFEFRWKWTEWLDDINLPELHPKKVFIVASLDKEIRLSFAKRVRETLPEAYHHLIPAGKDKDMPDFKYASDDTPYAPQARQLLALLRKKASDEDIQEIINSIDAQAAEQGVSEPLITSTDAFVTSICYMGSKSLSHVLSCIERNKERLLSIGPQSEPARQQIIQSVFSYWRDQPGIAVNIIDKLLNYTILTPLSVILWALGPDRLANADPSVRRAQLADPAIYEMVAGTISKVTTRLRQIRDARIAIAAAGSAADDDQRAMLDDTLLRERDAMRALLATVDDCVERVAAAAGVEDGMMDDGDAELVRGWAGRWARVFRRRAAVEEAVVGEAAVGVAVSVVEREIARIKEEKKATLEADTENAANGVGLQVNGGGDGEGQAIGGDGVKAEEMEEDVL